MEFILGFIFGIVLSVLFDIYLFKRVCDKHNFDERLATQMINAIMEGRVKMAGTEETENTDKE